ncbi:hypothetical protein GQ457_03G023330 [Hibiscus cannabinus]
MMEDHLYCKDLYEPITFQTMPEGKIEREWELLNRKAVAMICKYIDKSLFEHVSTYTNAYELWSKLESMIQKKTPRNKAHLVRHLVKLEYNDGQSMIEHLNNSKGLVNQLSKIEMKIDDELRALLLLSSLRESSLMNGEARRKKRDLPRKSEAKVKNGTVKCDQVDPKKKEENNTTVVAVKEEEDGIFLFGGDNYLNLAQDDCSWIVDSGASFHVTPHIDFFSTYQTSYFGAVKMGNQETSKIVGIGNVILKTNTDCEIVLNYVRYVPDIRLNLISAGKLDDAGYMNLFGGGKWKLTRNRMIVARGNKQGSLYVTRGKICKGEANVACANSCLELWHKSLGHISEKGLQILAQNALIPEVKGKAIQPCIHCLAGKQHKVSFRRDQTRGEYRIPFEEYCKSYGIKFEKTPPKTPQLNGVAERMNRTIEERVRSMLSNAQLSKSFWGEAVKTATKIVNHSPSALDGEILEQVWTGKKVSYEHFKVFGCRAFVHIPKDELNKRIVRNRDVVFLEDQTIEDTKQSGSPMSKAITQIIQDPVPMIRHETIEEQNAENQDENNDSPTDESSIEANEDQPIETIGPKVAPEPEVTPQPELRRSVRERRPSNRYPPLEYVIVVNEGEPQSFDQAMEDDHKEQWLKAMQEEMQSLHENQTYDLVELPKGRHALKNKWVYKLKTDESNKKPRHKARIVVKCCNQKEGIDF